MATPLPPEFYERLKQQPKQSSFNAGQIIPWLFLLAIMGALGGAYYYFFWQYRLPQERELHDLQGHTIRARLEARNDEVLRYTLPGDRFTRYLPIQNLVPADQDFVRKLAADLEFKYPLDMVFTDAEGKPQPVRIEARGPDWVKYIALADNSVGYRLIRDLPVADQEVVQLLLPNLTFTYPVDYVLSVGPIAGAKIKILGRSNDVIKYSKLSDSVVHYVPIQELSALDQVFMSQLPMNISTEYPLDYTLTHRRGPKLPGQIEGRSSEAVKLGSATAAASAFYPIEDLTEADQKFVRQLPINLTLSCPLDCVLTDQEGGAMPMIRVEGRSASVVKFSRLESGVEDYYALASFSISCQRFLTSLPSNFVIQYPFEYTIVVLSGRALPAQVLGRNKDEVKFQLSDGKIYTYPLMELSLLNQALLKALPINLGVASNAEAAVESTRNRANLVISLQTEIGPLLKSDDNMMTGMHDPKQNLSSRTAMLVGLDGNRDQIEALYKQLRVATANIKSNDPAIVKVWRTRIDVIIKDNEGKRLQLAEAKMTNTDRHFTQERLRQAQEEMAGLLKQINAATGEFNQP